MSEGSQPPEADTAGTAAPADQPLLQMRGIVKTFPGVRALDGVDLTVRPGEVHCLLGQNGAGKSTLIKVLAGAHRPDEGEITWLGEPIVARHPGRGDLAGDLHHLPGARPRRGSQRGREPLPGAREVAGRAVAAQGHASGGRRALLARLGHEEIRADREVGTLPASGQQIVSMARALSHDTRVIVMDEPSAALDQQEVQTLFKVIRDLTSQGVAVVYISHRLEEIREVGDRVTVLKDGRTVATDLAAKDTPTSELIRLMTGRSIEYVFPPRTPTEASAAPVLEVAGLSLDKVFADVDLLRGGGRDRRPRRAGGLGPLRDPGVGVRRAQAVRRLGDGGRQAAQARLGRRCRQGRHRPRARGAQEPGPAPRPADLPEHHCLQPRPLRPRGLLEELGGADLRGRVDHGPRRTPPRASSVRCGRCRAATSRRSCSARWLLRERRGAAPRRADPRRRRGRASEIYALIRSLAARGMAVVVVSSEVEEVLGLVDRVLVVREGHIVHTGPAQDIDEHKVLDLVMEGSAV